MKGNTVDWEELQHTQAVEVDEDDGGGWIVTFSDLMSLLLCFFILLFSFSTVQELKFKQLIQSLQEAFGVQQVPEAGTREGLEMIDVPAESEPQAIDELGGLVQRELEEIASEVEELIIKNKLQGMVSVQISQRGAVVTISDVILFPVGEAEFTTEAYPILVKITDLIKQFPYHINVEGHTDNRPIHTRQYPSNWELSACRAARLVRFFIENGVEPTRLSAEGFAEFKPVADNNTPEGRAKNRRVEIVYTRESIVENMKKRMPQQEERL